MAATDFLATWLDRPGGAERANLHAFIIGLCDLLGVAPPQPADAGSRDNDYVFERAVRRLTGDGGYSTGRIDLYKRGHFLLEAKQSLKPCKPPPLAGELDNPSTAALQGRGRRNCSGRWDRLMRVAFRQAREYILDLPPDHAAPPFLIVCDVGHVFEVYADFSGTGRSYSYFPDRHSYRVYLEDFEDPQICARFAAIWEDPLRLDPARRRQQATREIAEELAGVSLWLERVQNVARPEAARFLMHCIFTMFACSVGLLPEGGLSRLIRDCLDRPEVFALLLKELWTKMSDPIYQARFFPHFGAHVPFFGGMLKGAKAFVLHRGHLEALLRAAERSWSEVEPAVFGALLEEALDRDDRRRLGAHFTPRAHVERLVQAVVMEPLRTEWREAQVQIERFRNDGMIPSAQEVAQRFHSGLRKLRVLDPACGTGNFLYIALELVKGLEAEVLETLVQLGRPESLGLDGVEPSQFLGLEVNRQAAIIAELVLWIGFLQLHYRNRSGHPAEPILRDFGTIQVMDALVTSGDAPRLPPEQRSGPQLYSKPRPAPWPAADFIVGNPPFMGGKDLRTRLGDRYAEALWSAYPQMNRSADLVMYWWERAAQALTEAGSRLRRFGFVTTNSIVQTFQRPTLDRWLGAETPLHLVMAIPDHPWTRASLNAAAVRVAMTVAARGPGEGVLLQLLEPQGGDDDEAAPAFRSSRGRINADLSVGVDLTRCEPLLANRELCSPGVKLHGGGFIVSLEQARSLGLGRRPGLETYIRPYCNGRDVVQRSRDAWVIDLYPLPAETVRARFPEVYQHLLTTVKPERDGNRMAFRRRHWWWFGATHEMYRSFTAGLDRYIATPETAKHRVFVFLDGGMRADNMLVAFGLADAFHLGLLSSRPHLVWARAVGAVLEDRPRYTKSACFDPFPFPDVNARVRDRLAQTAEDLDGMRREVRREHPDLTLTTLYNALQAVRAGRTVDPDTIARGRILILRELHDRLDALAAEAYGWPDDMDEAEILRRVAELNRIRAAEEKMGLVRWLRPEHQARRLPIGAGLQDLDLVPHTAKPQSASLTRMPSDRGAQTVAVLHALEDAAGGLAVEAIAARFSGGRRHLPRIEAALLVLEAYGRISRLPDGRYLARRAA